LLIPRIKISIIILALFLAGSIAAKAIGSLQSINPALRGFVEGCKDKPQPCWYGFVPDVTSRFDAEKIAKKLGFIACHIQFDYSRINETITAIELQECSGILYGDLAQQFQFSLPLPHGIWPTMNISAILTDEWPFWEVIELRIAKVDA
jgi:hypothetical protein